MNHRIAQYDVVMSASARLLKRDVQKALDEGWQPHGSPFQDAANFTCQVMVRYEEEDDWRGD